MKQLLTFTIVASTISAGICLADDANWTGWLGPKRDGWVGHFKAPTTWPSKLKKQWQTEVGAGYGSPIVVGNRVFQHSRQGGEEVVRCVDLTTGDVAWKKSYPAPFKVGGGGEYHGKGPKSCPIYADGRVFTLSISGVLTAWKADTGKKLWSRDFENLFKSGHPNWGATTSPIVDGDRVVVHFGTDDEGTLMALNVRTGNEEWQQGHVGASYSSPLLVETNGVKQIVEWNHLFLSGIESETGKLLWKYSAPHVGTDQNMPTPTFHKGRILLGGENRGIQSIEPRRFGKSWGVKQLWHQRKVALDMSTAVMNGKYLYGMSHYGKGRLFCLDPNSGDIKWQGPGRLGSNVTFLSIPGHIVALTDSGEVQIVAATPDEYKKVASYQVAETATWAPPVLLEDSLLIKDTTSLIRWSLK
ncbi:MAG: serine/threonine protein kinase [Planctomycetaceae bacterium]|nr:serine/threonine protein kinase [Planctomycetaceae bacterium]